MKEINCNADRFYSFTVLRDDSSDTLSFNLLPPSCQVSRLTPRGLAIGGLRGLRAAEANYILMKLSMLRHKGHTRYGIPIPWLCLAAILVQIVS